MSTGSEDRTLTMSSTQHLQGSYYFRVKVDHIISNTGKLAVEAGKTVTVENQVGALLEGSVGTVTFPVKTKNIDVSKPGTVFWYADEGGNVIATPEFITNTTITDGSENRTLTMNIKEPPSGIYYFRVKIDNGESNTGMLTIVAKLTILSKADVARIVTCRRAGRQACGRNSRLGDFPCHYEKHCHLKRRQCDMV